MTFGSIAGTSSAANIVLDGVPLTLNQAGFTNTVYDGLITGSGQMIENEHGYLNLGGADNVGGGTVVTAGYLLVSGSINGAGAE